MNIPPRKQHNSGFLDLVEQARSQVTEISVDELEQWLKADKEFVLLDVREESEYVQSFIPGAYHLSKGLIECKIEAAIPERDTSLVLYCGGGYRSVLAAENLQKMGYSKVYSLIGGYRGWCQTQAEKEQAQ